MKSDRSAYLPIGLVPGTAFGALLGNPALGALLGMVTGLVSSLANLEVSRKGAKN